MKIRGFCCSFKQGEFFVNVQGRGSSLKVMSGKWNMGEKAMSLSVIKDSKTWSANVVPFAREVDVRSNGNL